MTDMTIAMRDALHHLCRGGASHADARYYPQRDDETLAVVQGNLKSAERSVTTGIGIRVLYNGAWGFAAASSPDALATVAATARQSAPRGTCSLRQIPG
ncbi:MAG: hypothetical protein N2595_09905 [bacterium]|nr:hypothetical protein [bacterium]